LLTAVVAMAYGRSLGDDGRVAHGRAMALVSLTFASATIAAVLTRLRTRVSRVIVGGTIALSVLLVQTPALAARLHVEPLHLDDWAVAIVGGLAAVCGATTQADRLAGWFCSTRGRPARLVRGGRCAGAGTAHHGSAQRNRCAVCGHRCCHFRRRRRHNPRARADIGSAVAGPAAAWRVAQAVHRTLPSRSGARLP
jgi:hypothetical protein